MNANKTWTVNENTEPGKKQQVDLFRSQRSLKARPCKKQEGRTLGSKTNSKSKKIKAPHTPGQYGTHGSFFSLVFVFL
jgi:hypothetical protein